MGHFGKKNFFCPPERSKHFLELLKLVKNGFEVILGRLWAFKPSMIMRWVQTSGNMSLTYFPWRKDSGAIRITKKSPQWNLWLVSALVPIVHWVDWSYYSQVWDWESLARFPSPEGGTDHLSLDTQGRRATINTRDQKSLKRKMEPIILNILTIDSHLAPQFYPLFKAQ